MTKLVLESFAEHLRENIELNPNDDAVWRNFLKMKYGIPMEVNEETNGQGQEEELRKRSQMASDARTSGPEGRP
jgi:hypothetical protein